MNELSPTIKRKLKCLFDQVRENENIIADLKVKVERNGRTIESLRNNISKCDDRVEEDSEIFQLKAVETLQ